MLQKILQVLSFALVAGVLQAQSWPLLDSQPWTWDPEITDEQPHTVRYAYWMGEDNGTDIYMVLIEEDGEPAGLLWAYQSYSYENGNMVEFYDDTNTTYMESWYWDWGQYNSSLLGHWY